jgi:phage shock protein PspC (stress-responsive transcriptional regulator)
MEKTIQITIASTGFSLTEGAFAVLSRYLESLKAHFAGTPEKDEILRDIESRIAEKLIHKRHQIVTEDDITAVTGEIGDASEFDDEAEVPKASVSGGRKLYRDMDNAWLAGVSSGIAVYFDIDAFWIRLLFLISLFFGGAGVLLYIILWILIPEATSASQKLEMRGHPVDLEGITRVVKESVENVRESGAIRRLFQGIHALISGFFRVLGKIIGAGFVVGSFFAMIGLMVGLGIVLTNWNAPYNDFPLRGVVSGALLLFGTVAGFFAILIPLILLFSLGIRLVSRKVILPSVVGFGLVGLWALAIAATGTIAATSAGKFYEYQRTNPDYQVETHAVEVPPFSKVNVSDARITIKKGDLQTVEITGRTIERDNTIVEVVDGALVIHRKDYSGKMCIFCNNDPAEVAITTPDLENLFVEGASVRFDQYSDSALYIESFAGHVRGALSSDTLEVKSDGGSFNMTLEIGTLTINAENSRFELDGNTDSAAISIEDTSFSADRLMLASATLQAFDSYGSINAATLESNNDENSRVVNVATRTLTD